jgi:hypothetical protein
MQGNLDTAHFPLLSFLDHISLQYSFSNRSLESQILGKFGRHLCHQHTVLAKDIFAGNISFYLLLIIRVFCIVCKFLTLSIRF